MEINKISLLLILAIPMILFNLPYLAIAQQSQGLINWLEICKSPFVDAIITGPCHTLTTPDGYTLTKEGERVLGCLGGGTLAVLAGIPELTTMGEIVGCEPGNSITDEIDSLSVISDSNEKNEQLTQSYSWNYFVFDDGLSYIQLPSNWVNIPSNESKSSSMEYLFGYGNELGVMAMVMVFVDKPTQYSNSLELTEAIISADEEKNDFRLLEPINCETSTLNDAPSCTYSYSGVIDGYSIRGKAFLSVDEGIEIGATFMSTTSDYDSLLTTGKRIIESIRIDSDKVEGISSNQLFDLSSELPPIPPETTTDLSSELPPIPGNKTDKEMSPIPQNQSDTKKTSLPDFEIFDF